MRFDNKEQMEKISEMLRKKSDHKNKKVEIEHQDSINLEDTVAKEAKNAPKAENQDYDFGRFELKENITGKGIKIEGNYKSFDPKLMFGEKNDDPYKANQGDIYKDKGPESQYAGHNSGKHDEFDFIKGYHSHNKYN